MFGTQPAFLLSGFDPVLSKHRVQKRKSLRLWWNLWNDLERLPSSFWHPYHYIITSLLSLSEGNTILNSLGYSQMLWDYLLIKKPEILEYCSHESESQVISSCIIYHHCIVVLMNHQLHNLELS